MSFIASGSDDDLDEYPEYSKCLVEGNSHDEHLVFVVDGTNRETTIYNETDYLLSKKRYNYVKSKSYSYFSAFLGCTYIRLAAFCALCSLVAITYLVNQQENTKPSWIIQRYGYDALDVFQNYESSDFLKYRFLMDYDGIIEPHSQSFISATSIEYYSSEEIISFSVCQADASTFDDCATGTIDSKSGISDTFYIQCNPYDILTVLIYSGEQELHGFKVICIYVRREIRSLNEVDLNATLDAMQTLWYSTDADGQALYGEDFHNISYFTTAHYFGASHRNADHIHEGVGKKLQGHFLVTNPQDALFLQPFTNKALPIFCVFIAARCNCTLTGFLTQHMKLTNAFEKAMQAVDLSVALPYWDFTIDAGNFAWILWNLVVESGGKWWDFLCQ